MSKLKFGKFFYMDGSSYSRIMGAAFYGMLFIGLAIGIAIGFISLVVLKLLGVLTLSWLYILGSVPALCLVVLFIAILVSGIKAVFFRR